MHFEPVRKKLAAAVRALGHVITKLTELSVVERLYVLHIPNVCWNGREVHRVGVPRFGATSVGVGIFPYLVFLVVALRHVDG
jgi:hypothetical protein